MSESYEALERYKTRKFLESKPHRLRMAAATNKAASRIKEARESGATAQELSNTLVNKLRSISEEIVGKETVPRRRNCKHMRYSNEERAALGNYIDANKEWALEFLRQKKNNSHYKVKKLQQISRKAKTLYYMHSKSIVLLQLSVKCREWYRSTIWSSQSIAELRWHSKRCAMLPGIFMQCFQHHSPLRWRAARRKCQADHRHSGITKENNVRDGSPICTVE